MAETFVPSEPSLLEARKSAKRVASRIRKLKKIKSAQNRAPVRRQSAARKPALAKNKTWLTQPIKIRNPLPKF